MDVSGSAPHGGVQQEDVGETEVGGRRVIVFVSVIDFQFRVPVVLCSQIGVEDITVFVSRSSGAPSFI